MGSYNYIGNTYASAHEGLNETVLRGERGFPWLPGDRLLLRAELQLPDRPIR